MSERRKEKKKKKKKLAKRFRHELGSVQSAAQTPSPLSAHSRHVRHSSYLNILGKPQQKVSRSEM